MSSPASYNPRYPSIADLKIKARKRIPGFAFDYLDGAIDDEICKARNREDFHRIQMIPRYLRSVDHPNTGKTLFGKHYKLPLGVAPVGLSNMMWPGAESAIAQAAQDSGIPYILSTYGTTELETIAKLAPDVCWFQLYVPKQKEVMHDLIDRARIAGFKALVVTLDIPVGGKRNRELKNGLQLPFSLTPKLLWQAATHPHWALETLRQGQPRFKNIIRYIEDSNLGLSEFITRFAMHGITRERLEEIREAWKGPLIFKGLQHLVDIQTAIDIGADGLILSNHGGRQLDAAPSSLATLTQVPESVKEQTCIMLDSGIRNGMDLLRARALGAQFCFSGRSFFYGAGALGNKGPEQVINIFKDELTRGLQQLGCPGFDSMDASWLADSPQAMLSSNKN